MAARPDFSPRWIGKVNPHRDANMGRPIRRGFDVFVAQLYACETTVSDEFESGMDVEIFCDVYRRALLACMRRDS